MKIFVTDSNINAIKYKCNEKKTPTNLYSCLLNTKLLTAFSRLGQFLSTKKNTDSASLILKQRKDNDITDQCLKNEIHKIQ